MKANIMVVDPTKELRSAVRLLRDNGYWTIPEYVSASKNKILNQEIAFGHGKILEYIREELGKNGDTRLIVCGGSEDVVSGEIILNYILNDTFYEGAIVYRPVSLSDKALAKAVAYKNIETCFRGEYNNEFLLEKIRALLSR